MHNEGTVVSTVIACIMRVQWYLPTHSQLNKTTLPLSGKSQLCLKHRNNYPPHMIFPPFSTLSDTSQQLYFSELYNSEKHIHVIQYLNNRLDIITMTSLDYTIRWDFKTPLLVVVGLPQGLHYKIKNTTIY